MPAYSYKCGGHAQMTVARGIKEPEVVPACAVCSRPMRRVYEVPLIVVAWKR
jgi:predicted nucleic acid-binding Zn ribbon protein